MTPYEICVTLLILIPLAIWAYNDREVFTMDIHDKQAQKKLLMWNRGEIPERTLLKKEKKNLHKRRRALLKQQIQNMKSEEQ